MARMQVERLARPTSDLTPWHLQLSTLLVDPLPGEPIPEVLAVGRGLLPFAPVPPVRAVRRPPNCGAEGRY